MLTEKAAMYSTLGISKEVFAFGTKIEEELKERFAKIDEIAEYNQLKVIHAMQASKVSEACLYGTTGYGYNDLGRDTLELLPSGKHLSYPALDQWDFLSVYTPPSFFLPDILQSRKGSLQLTQ